MSQFRSLAVVAAFGVLLVAAVGGLGCGKPPASVTHPKPQPAKVAAQKQPAARPNVAKAESPPHGQKPGASKRVELAEPDQPFVVRVGENDPPGVAQPENSPTARPPRQPSAEFDLPEIDEGKIAAAGIRKLTGQHLILYTDLPETNEEVQKLPRIFDLAVAEWARYFEIDPAKLNDWKLVGYLMESKARFQGAGLYTSDLPDFPNGFHKGSRIWLYDQPSDYYRRHLLIHEGTHAFMSRWLDGVGPPWYSEGMAELLGTHEWDGQQLKLGYNPPDKALVPYWGRVKIVRDEFAANRGLTLLDIFRYDGQAHLKNEAYGWCWAATSFLNQHPRAREAFLALKHKSGDRSIEFSKQFHEQLKPHWADIAEDWQLYVYQLDYGYDVARAAVVRGPAVPLPAAGATVEVVADRGWQSSGFELVRGKTYEITAQGRYQVASQPKPWPCEPGGITIEYHQGHPLGKLLAAVGTASISPLANPEPIGLAARIQPRRSGILYLTLNDSPAQLADNSGHATVTIREVAP